MSPTPYAFFRGEYVPLADAKVGIMTHALHYGTGVFEGIRGNWNSENQTISIFPAEGSTTIECCGDAASSC